MIIMIGEGEEGKLICHMVLKIRTVALSSDKDTPGLVDRNFHKHRLESIGTVYDYEFDTATEI